VHQHDAAEHSKDRADDRVVDPHAISGNAA
jgi:hypothetical protein